MPQLSEIDDLIGDRQVLPSRRKQNRGRMGTSLLQQPAQASCGQAAPATQTSSPNTVTNTHGLVLSIHCP